MRFIFRLAQKCTFIVQKAGQYVEREGGESPESFKIRRGSSLSFRIGHHVPDICFLGLLPGMLQEHRPTTRMEKTRRGNFLTRNMWAFDPQKNNAHEVWRSEPEGERRERRPIKAPSQVANWTTLAGPGENFSNFSLCSPQHLYKRTWNRKNYP